MGRKLVKTWYVVLIFLLNPTSVFPKRLLNYDITKNAQPAN